MSLTSITPPSLKNPVCELQLQKLFVPSTFGPAIPFVHTNFGAQVDVIDTNVQITRNPSGGFIFNPLFEGASGPLTPTNTEWHYLPSPLPNFQPPTITGLAYQPIQAEVLNTIGSFSAIVGTDWVMHDTANDKYYLFTFTQWTSGSGGGGFQYTRTEVIFGAVICSGRIVFDDLTWMDTAPSALVSGTPFRVAMFDSTGNALTESLIEMSPTVNVGTNVLTGSVDCLIIGNNISAVNASTSFIYGSNSNIDNALECFVVGHNNIDFSGAISVFSCIVLGSLTTFLGNNAGVYSLGDTNSYDDVNYSAVFGQDNTLANVSFSTINGAYNTVSSNTGISVMGRNNTVGGGSQSTIVGYSNSINNPTTSSVFGHQNVVGSLLNGTVLIGKNNSALAIVAGGVNILNTNFGLKITNAFAGIGGSGFNPIARFHIKSASSSAGGLAFRVENLLPTVQAEMFNIWDDGYITNSRFIDTSSTFYITSKITGRTSLKVQAEASTTGRGIQIVQFNDAINGFGIDMFVTNAGVKTIRGVSNITTGAIHTLGLQATALNIGEVIFTPTASAHIRGIDALVTSFALKIENSATTNLLSITNTGRLNVSSLPVSNVGLVAGDLWNNAGVVNIV